MNFTWLNKQWVRSDSGFEVRGIDRFTMEYVEGERTISVDSEPGLMFGVSCICIDSDAFSKWDQDSGGEPLTVKQQQEVLNNFKAALEFQGLKLSVG